MNVPLETVTRNLEEETAKGTIRSYVNFLKNNVPNIQAKDVKARTTEENVILATYNKLKPYIPEFEKLYDEMVSIKEMREKEEHKTVPKVEIETTKPMQTEGIEPATEAEAHSLLDQQEVFKREFRKMEALINLAPRVELEHLKTVTENQIEETQKALKDIERAINKPVNERNLYDKKILAENDISDIAVKNVSYEQLNNALNLINRISGLYVCTGT